jgi:hypothetical protein
MNGDSKNPLHPGNITLSALILINGQVYLKVGQAHCKFKGLQIS